MVIDARGRINSGAFPDNQLDDRLRWVFSSTKPLERGLEVSVEERANLVLSDVKKHADNIDARNPGSTFAHELASY